MGNKSSCALQLKQRLSALFSPCFMQQLFQHTEPACRARRAAVHLVHISTATAPAGTFAPPANAIGINGASGIYKISALSYTYHITTLELCRFVISGDPTRELLSVVSKLRKNTNKGNDMWFYDHCYKTFYQLRDSTPNCNAYSYK